MLMNLYSPWDLKFVSAKGIFVNTDQGEFIDTFSGIGVTAMGHCFEPSLERAVEKMRRFSHICNYFVDEDAVKMADILTSLDGREGQVFFTNSGAESVEAIVKAVLKFRNDKGRKGAIVSFEGNFHGRTCGALSITWGKSMREPFEPMLGDVVFLPPTAEALAGFAATNEIDALFVESIQGNSGVVPMNDYFMAKVQELREKGDFILVADEIQSGFGRTGKPYAYQHWGLEPDAVSLAKGIGGGLPLGAAVFYGWEPFGLGAHGTTFAPNPVSLAAGLAIAELITPRLMDEVTRKGQYFMERLKALPWVRSVRGKGLMIGAVCEDPSRVKKEAFARKVLLNTAGDAVRFLPPLNIAEDEIDLIVQRLDFEV